MCIRDRSLGGVVGSLRNRATEEYDHLPDDAHKATMQRVMLRMVATEGGELARRRVALGELGYPTESRNLSLINNLPRPRRVQVKSWGGQAR